MDILLNDSDVRTVKPNADGDVVLHLVEGGGRLRIPKAVAAQIAKLGDIYGDIHTYAVTGTETFPMDLLRAGKCWPDDHDSVMKMGWPGGAQRTITVAGIIDPRSELVQGRLRERGWYVVQYDVKPKRAAEPPPREP